MTTFANRASTILPVTVVQFVALPFPSSDIRRGLTKLN